MKKALSLILAFVMCLSLCACGTTDETVTTSEIVTTSQVVTTSKNSLAMKDAIIGTWKCYYELTKDSGLYDKAGDTYIQTIELYKGGTGRIYWYNETRNHAGSNVSLTWEIKDDVVNITYNIFGDSNEGYEYDFETDTLTKVDGSRIFDRY